MNKRSVFLFFLVFPLFLTACGGSPPTPGKDSFDISGSPNPLYYGGSCSTPVLTILVSGPGAGLRINSIIAAYQVFDGSGKKVDENTASLHPVPDAPLVNYDADRIIIIPGGEGSAPDSPIYEFGNGHVDFAAMVYATFDPKPSSGPDETYYFTSTKSVPILPCSAMGSTPGAGLPGGIVIVTIIPPVPADKPSQPDEGGGPPPPPSCSADPNNPNCVP